MSDGVAISELMREWYGEELAKALQSSIPRTNAEVDALADKWLDKAIRDGLIEVVGPDQHRLTQKGKQAWMKIVKARGTS